MKIGGNTEITIQTKTTTKNVLGERVESWEDLITLKGFLDYVQGQVELQNFNALVQESTHLFIFDYEQLNGVHFNSEDTRLVFNGGNYQILMIDDVMGLHEQVEIYLKYIGIGQGA